MAEDKADKKRKTSSDKAKLPVIPLRGIVAYPKLTLAFDAGRMATIAALNEAMKAKRRVVLLTQKDVNTEEPKASDLYRVGTVAEIVQILEVKESYYKVLTEGLYRVKIGRFYRKNPGFYLADLENYPRQAEGVEGAGLDKIELEAAKQKILNLFEKYGMETGYIPPDVIAFSKTLDSFTRLIDLVSVNVNFNHKVKQYLLEEEDLKKRLDKIILTLTQELQLVKYSQEIDAKVKQSIDKQQRDYFLREQMRLIEDELAEGDGDDSDLAVLRQKLAASTIPEEYKDKIAREINRVSKMPANFPEASVQMAWLEMLVNLPFGKLDEESVDLTKARKILNRDHYGLDKVKQRIIEYLAVRKLKLDQGIKQVKGPILCLVGPPGVGKTSIAKSIAEAIGRRYIRMSLGGVRDESEIRGHRRTYVGAMAGRIMQAISHVNIDNPLFLLDEIDKLGNDFRGDPSSALLEVLDPEQNNSFRDHYVEIPYDLSHVLFITTANSAEDIPEPLLDRMELISLSGYTEIEKLEIAKRYLLPKQLEANGLDKKQLQLTDGAIRLLINSYTAEAGVRQLERELAGICRRVAIKIAEGQVSTYKLKQSGVEELLGKVKYFYDKAEKEDLVGVAKGLAWTYAGGDTLAIEVNILSGTGHLEMTGQLGDVMKESAKAALSYCRSRSDQLNMPDDFINKHDIHIHVPAGAVPKDGPSAGITIATALASAITGKKVRHDLAMTGEISLRGRVLPIGGLKEKAVAASRARISEILIPKDNIRDIEDIPDSVKSKLKIKPVDTVDQVLKIALLD